MVQFEPDAMFGTRYHAAPDGVFMVLNLGNILFLKMFFENLWGFLSMVFLRGNLTRPC